MWVHNCNLSCGHSLNAVEYCYYEQQETMLDEWSEDNDGQHISAQVVHYGSQVLEGTVVPQKLVGGWESRAHAHDDIHPPPSAIKQYLMRTTEWENMADLCLLKYPGSSLIISISQQINSHGFY